MFTATRAAPLLNINSRITNKLIIRVPFLCKQSGVGKNFNQGNERWLAKTVREIILRNDLYLWRVHSHYMQQLSLAKLLLRLSCLSLFFFPRLRFDILFSIMQANVNQWYSAVWKNSTMRVKYFKVFWSNLVVSILLTLPLSCLSAHSK